MTNEETQPLSIWEVTAFYNMSCVMLKHVKQISLPSCLSYFDLFFPETWKVIDRSILKSDTGFAIKYFFSHYWTLWKLFPDLSESWLKMVRPLFLWHNSFLTDMVNLRLGTQRQLLRERNPNFPLLIEFREIYMEGQWLHVINDCSLYVALGVLSD